MGVYCLCADSYFSLEAAASNPETLSQEAIIDNLDPVEAARLSKIRNIGIAVGTIPGNIMLVAVLDCI